MCAESSPWRPFIAEPWAEFPPAGTGMEYYRNVRLSQEMEQAGQKVQKEVTREYEEAERALELLRHESENEAEELAAE